MVDLPPPGRIGTLVKRFLSALHKSRIRPSLDLGHVCLMQAACMFEGRLTREQFVELVGAWWDQVTSVEGPAPEAERTPLPEHDEPLPLELLEAQARRIGELIASVMPRGAGFTLLLFDTNTTKGHVTYLSSAVREDMIEALRELLRRLDRHEDATKPATGAN